MERAIFEFQGPAEKAVFGGKSFAAMVHTSNLATAQDILTARNLTHSQDATLDELLIADGAADPVELLRARARFLGMALYDPAAHTPDAQAILAITAQTCLQRGVLPTRDSEGKPVLVTCRTAQLNTLRARLPMPWRDAPMALSQEGPLQAVLAKQARVPLTHAASCRVPDVESCRGWGANQHRRVALTLLALIAFAVLVTTVPTQTVTVLVLWASVTLGIAAVHKTAACLAFLLAPASPAPPRPLDRRLPKVSVLVPLFRERNVATVLVERLGRLSYPKALLDVVLVLEETDHLTREILEMATLPHWMRVIVVPDGQPRTKPRAMNYALDFCRGDIIGIWDAEDAPAPDQIDKVADRFLSAPDDLVCLQGVLDYYNPRQNWLARCFTVEYATWFRVMMPGMARLGFAIPLGGTTLFFRRDVLEALGGWDAHNVTEDADLGFRLARHGYRTEMLATTTGEEANCRAWPWIKQRSRWLKGYMVTWLVHMRNPRALLRQMGPWKFLGMQTHFVTALSQFLLAPLLWSFWLIPLGVTHPLESTLPRSVLLTMGTLFAVVELLTIAAGMIAVRGRGHRHLLPWVPTLHFYFPLGCIAAYKALWELVFAPFYWDKTEHGLSQPQPGLDNPLQGP